MPDDSARNVEPQEYLRSTTDFVTQKLLEVKTEIRAEIGTKLILSLESGHPDPEESKKLIAHLLTTTPDVHVSKLLIELWDLDPEEDDFTTQASDS